MKVQCVLRPALLAAVVLGVMVGMAGVAKATGSLQIVDENLNLRIAPTGGVCSGPGDPSHCEVIGDAGGTNYAGGPGGPGLPTQNGGWAVGPGFSTDPTFGGARGISGWHGSYLNLTHYTFVSFQFMGGGNSSLFNSFWLNPGTGWVKLFDDSVTPCGVSGSSPTCNNTNEFTFNLTSGLIQFGFDINGVRNSSIAHNIIGSNSDDLAQQAGFFLGCDPYLTSGPFENMCNAVYAGLTDLPQPGDHDFQDFGVRISEIPEPSTWMLMGTGLLGFLGYGWRRKKQMA